MTRDSAVQEWFRGIIPGRLEGDIDSAELLILFRPDNLAHKARELAEQLRPQEPFTNADVDRVIREDTLHVSIDEVVRYNDKEVSEMERLAVIAHLREYDGGRGCPYCTYLIGCERLALQRARMLAG